MKIPKSRFIGITALLLLGFVVGFTACYAVFRQRLRFVAPSLFDSAHHRDLAWLDTADPVADFRRDFAAGERRYWCVSGAMCLQLLPAVDQQWAFDRIKAQGVRIIPYTSLCSGDQWSDHDRAYSYAERYNALLRYHLEQ